MTPFASSAEAGGQDVPTEAGGESPGAPAESPVDEQVPVDEEEAGGEGESEEVDPTEEGGEEPSGEEGPAEEGGEGAEELGFCAQWTATCGEWAKPNPCGDWWATLPAGEAGADSGATKACSWTYLNWTEGADEATLADYCESAAGGGACVDAAEEQPWDMADFVDCSDEDKVELAELASQCLKPVRIVTALVTPKEAWETSWTSRGL